MAFDRLMAASMWNDNGCLICPLGNSGNMGYSKVRMNGKDRSGHRIAWATTNGVDVETMPSDLFVRHQCDVPRCINPAHLLSGTARENTHDAIGRGRLKKPPVQPRQPRCKRGHRLHGANIDSHAWQREHRRKCALCQRLRTIRSQKRIGLDEAFEYVRGCKGELAHQMIEDAFSKES